MKKIKRTIQEFIELVCSGELLTRRYMESVEISAYYYLSSTMHLAKRDGIKIHRYRKKNQLVDQSIPVHFSVLPLL